MAAPRARLSGPKLETLGPDTRSKIERQMALTEARSQRLNVEPQERRQHDQVVTVETEQAGRTARRVETQRLLDRYCARRLLSMRQWRAGDILYQAWFTAGAQQMKTTNFSIRVDGTRGQFIESERQAQLRLQVNQAMRDVGLELSGILVHTVLLDQPPADLMKAIHAHPRAGIVILRMALDALARSYRV